MKRGTAIVIFAAVISLAKASDITGRVESASGNTVTITIDGDVLPSAGDKATIFFLLAGDTEVSVATATVTATTGPTVTAKIDDASGTVEKGHLVRIHRSNVPLPSNSPAVPPPTKSPPAVPPLSSSPVNGIPSVIKECETYRGQICGNWTLVGKQFKAVWENGATATLSIAGFGTGQLTVTRRDTNSPLTARYTGRISNNKVINGTVTWTQNGQSWSGTWKAQW